MKKKQKNPGFWLIVLLVTMISAQSTFANDERIIIQSFDNESDFTSSWASGESTIDWEVVDNTPVLEGQALQVTYSVMYDQSWGGQADLGWATDHIDGFYPIDPELHNAFSVWYNSIEASEDNLGRVTFNFYIASRDAGYTEERWQYRVDDILNDESGEWKEIVIPFESLSLWDGSDFGDGIFYPDRVWRIVISHQVSQEDQPNEGVIIWDSFTAYHDADIATTADPVSSETPRDINLNRNYPNPFNPGTNISYEIPYDMFVTLKIHNVMGQHVATLVNKRQSAGKHVVYYHDESLSSGVYFYRLQAGSFARTKQMLLIR